MCGPAGQCIADPTVVGCSDGTREGFINTNSYASIASCAGTWDRQSLRASSTGASCGNDLGKCTVPADACATGWHVCMANGWPSDLTGRVSAEDCHSGGAGTGRFMGASDTWYCESTPLQCFDGNPICCGSECSTVVAMCDVVWPGMTYGAPDNSCNNTGDTWNYKGVLCCKDPALTGTGDGG